MEQLIFFAIIILFSILESIARSRKARERREAGEVEPEQFEWAQEAPTWDYEIPTYDEDPSYDDVATMEETVPEEPEPPTAADLLEELSAVLSGQKPEPEARTRSIPKQSPPLPEPTPAPVPVRRIPETPPTPSPYAIPGSPGQSSPGYRPSRYTKDHVVHRAHAGFGTDPSERAPSLEGRIDPLAEPPSETAVAVRKLLRSDDPGLLRQALVLQEILGPPVSLRDER